MDMQQFGVIAANVEARIKAYAPVLEALHRMGYHASPDYMRGGIDITCRYAGGEPEFLPFYVACRKVAERRIEDRRRA